MSANINPMTKKMRDIAKAKKVFLEEWGDYVLARRAVVLKSENKIKTEPVVYHRLVQFANGAGKGRVDHSRGGIGKRVLDEVELNGYAPLWFKHTQKRGRYFASRKNLELIIQGVDGIKLKQMITALPAANPDKVNPKYKSFARIHGEYQEVTSAMQAMQSKRVSMEEKDAIFEETLFPLAAKLIQRNTARMRAPDKSSLPYAPELAQLLAYSASINPVYALDVVKRELPQITKKFEQAIGKLAGGAPCVDYLRSIYRDMESIPDPNAKVKALDAYCDALYRTLKAKN